MYQVACYYCHTPLYLFQAHTSEVTSYAYDMTPVKEEIHTCYWCALREGGDETNRE